MIQVNSTMKTNSNENKVEIISTDIVDMLTIKLRSDGIIHVHTSASEELSVESLKKLTELLGKIGGNKKVPLLFTLDEFALPPMETRIYWAIKESCPYSAAEAVLSNNLALKILVNFYLKFNHPKRPTKLFNKEEDAVKWLKTFL